ncbi:hypothetical protein [Asticcacaulis sp. 201]|uniref:hypothetical protein n=1 Tax=Asticcacaulis sp. 201 TaxID=3028787 RepID=UPI0029160CD4|nr:hypothetical protein [Asticcacaulis sp. 201]MDV6332310.1 hypothetical protein [Asticcacaulis sp. 201]
MQRHRAVTISDNVLPAMTLSIHTGVLRHRDILDIGLPSGKTAEALVDRFDVTGLYLIMNGKRLVCRPWRGGDGPVTRLPGTSSNWTVDRIDAHEPEVA